MCTSIAMFSESGCCGRNLDLEVSFGEQVVIAPRTYPFHFHELEDLNDHHALIGMANVASGQPLYAEAMNEHGLYMAGLNFPGNACYDRPDDRARYHAAPYELIPWILGSCRNVTEAKALLSSFAPLARPFSLTADGSRTLPLAELHWHICDGSRALVLETTVDGVCLYEDPIGVLTNNPPFDMQMFNLNNYMTLSCKAPVNAFADGLHLQEYGRGMGALGLPGDISPQSRFVRAAFVKLNSVCDDLPVSCVNQFFHILGSVENQRGCCRLSDGKCEITQYTCCCDADEGIYYYTTYSNHRISAVSLKSENLDGNKLIVYDLLKNEDIYSQNG